MGDFRQEMKMKNCWFCLRLPGISDPLWPARPVCLKNLAIDFRRNEIWFFLINLILSETLTRINWGYHLPLYRFEEAQEEV